jgi:hypothetical protein
MEPELIPLPLRERFGEGSSFVRVDRTRLCKNAWRSGFIAFWNGPVCASELEHVAPQAVAFCAMDRGPTDPVQNPRIVRGRVGKSLENCSVFA